MRLRSIRAGLLAVLLTPCLLPAQEAASAYPDSALREIVGAIRTLESENDAKCQATATRLENLMFGIPLTEEARFEKIRLQKALVLDVWRRASAVAREDDRSSVGSADFEPLVQAVPP